MIIAQAKAGHAACNVIAADHSKPAGSSSHVESSRAPTEAWTVVAEALLGGSADAIVAADRTGNIIVWNPGAERVFGYPVDVAMGQSLDIIIPESLRQRHWAGYSRVMETGLTRYGDGDLLAVPGTKHDGSRISLEFTVTLLREPDGSVTKA